MKYEKIEGILIDQEKEAELLERALTTLFEVAAETEEAETLADLQKFIRQNTDEAFLKDLKKILTEVKKYNLLMHFEEKDSL